jgi:HEAT repeat protein
MVKVSIQKEIEQLEKLLGGKDGYKREQARKALEKIGKPAVSSLIELLSHPNPLIRWEACKTLGAIKDPSAAAALVFALDDDTMEVNWVAAEALIRLKTKALVPLLRSLEKNFTSVFLRQGAHHILHALERERLLNKETLVALDTLRFLEPKISVAFAARKALDSLNNSK